MLKYSFVSTFQVHIIVVEYNTEWTLGLLERESLSIVFYGSFQVGYPNVHFV
jgi:hypothetical protein